jgi:hypothetical protein
MEKMLRYPERIRTPEVSTQHAGKSLPKKACCLPPPYGRGSERNVERNLDTDTLKACATNGMVVKAVFP